MNISLTADTFGGTLKYLRRRARLTQRELALAVGYTEAHICRLEKNERLPDVTTIAALFLPALALENDPAHLERLLQQAAQAHDVRRPTSISISQITIERQVEQELGLLEEIPTPLAVHISRSAWVRRIQATLAQMHAVMLCGLPGVGKTILAATVARDYSPANVFWLTLIPGVNTNVEALLRQLALFCLVQGVEAVKPLVATRADIAAIPLDQQVTIIRAALAQYPALLCFDDVHLLKDDEPSLSLLRHLSGIPAVSLVLISRQSVALPVPQLHIGGLEPEEAGKLAAGLGLDTAVPAIHDLLVKTEGNPMLIRLAAGQLVGTPSVPEAFVQHLDQTAVTAYLLKTVLHDLPPATRWLASLIAVFRHPLDLYEPILLEWVEKIAPPQLINETLADIQSRYLVENLHLAKLHPLLRDHLYTALSAEPVLKKRLHTLAARWSGRVSGDVVEAAYHWLHAGEPARAAEIISTHSEALFNQGQAPAAVQVVDETLQVLQKRQGKTTRLRCLLLMARGDLLRGTLRAAEAESSYRAALALAQTIPPLRAQIARSLAQILLQRGRAGEALELCQNAAAELSADNTVLRARLAAIECRVHLVLSQYEKAEKTAREALELAASFAHLLPQLADDVCARAERTLGWVQYTRRPQGSESLGHYRRALACARRAGLRSLEIATLSNLATALMEREEWEPAEQAFLEALQGCDVIGDLYAKAGILHNLGALYVQRQSSTRALQYLEQASQLERQVGDIEGLLSSEAACASILLSLGKVAEARLRLDLVLTEEIHSVDVWTLGSCLCLSGEVYLVQGAVATARAEVERVLALPGLQANARMYAWALCDLALVHALAGEIVAAQAIVESPPPADVGFSVMYHWQLARGVVALASGQPEQAQAIIAAAEVEAQQKGVRRDNRLGARLRSDPALPLSEAVWLMFLEE